MAVAKVVTAQRNFSGGEADIYLKRADELPLMKAAGRQMRNWRILNSGALANRPGRTLLAQEGPRVDQVIMSPTQTFYLAFGNGYLRVYNAAFTKVFDSSNGSISIPWVTATAQNVVWDIYLFSVYIAFAGMQPLVLTWDGVSQTSTWTLTQYAPTLQPSGQSRNAFYRLSPRGVTLQPSAVQGNITLTFSAGMNLVASHVGTRVRFVNRQILITAVNSPTSANGTVEESLYPGTIFGLVAGDLTQYISLGDTVIGLTSGAKGVVTAFYNNNKNMIVQNLGTTTFSSQPEGLIGPNGQIDGIVVGNGVPGQGPSIYLPQPTTVWDDEVMNSFRGWPASVFVDQGRVGFCDFPQLPGFIVWSAVANAFDLYSDAANAAPTNAIQEVAPRKSRVMYVVPGAEGSEFVFCDNGVYYIPINQTTPLQPGSVAFNVLTFDGVAQVKPRNAQQSIVFVGAGGTQLKAVQAIGAYYRPFIIDDITELHSHLLNNPVALAAPSSSTQYEERYLYLLNADGSILIGKYTMASGVIDAKNIGWLPWSGGGSSTWISALTGQSDLFITENYAPGGIAAVSFVEKLDAGNLLDAAMLYNSAPAALAPPAGKGPLWFFANGVADLVDNGRMMGTYQIDANGNLIPQNNAGENFASATLTVGQAWTVTFEPFVPAVGPGQDVEQRLRKRRIMRFEVYVQNSTGFLLARLFAGPLTRTSPALGTVMQQKRIPAWNQDDDPTQPPPLREQSYWTRPLGLNHDPRVAVIKDTPGKLILLECDLEVSV